MEAATQITNLTIDEINVGDSASYSRLVTEREVELFAAVSGDHNPVHLDPEYAATTQFGECIAHGMLTGAFVSAAIAMELPGPGTIYLGQNLQFRAPVLLGDTVTVYLEVIEKHDTKPWLKLSTTVKNQDDKEIARGEASVMAPAKKETVTVVPPPAVQLLDDAEAN
ncbi:MAG: MaoC family dehydratase [Luminiphilus sp.]|jgi:3-hydroxybutyryl-CoA dehydratase|nr:MaoC family dehydratase [Luminiphilus sp.]MDA0630454.1 MaoC family dehydratase [Pseudomonadota bacterium]